MNPARAERQQRYPDLRGRCVWPFFSHPKSVLPGTFPAHKIGLFKKMVDMSSIHSTSSPNPLKTVALFAAGTIVATLGAALLIRLMSERSLEHLARLASGESDYEHKHPGRRS